MGMSIGGKGGTVAEVNVVPLIDILLVLLVIFMIIPHHQKGLKAELPNQESTSEVETAAPTPIIVQVTTDGALKINQTAIGPGELRPRLEQIFALREHRLAFLQGERSVEFQTMAAVLDEMQSAGASPVGLLTSELEKNR
jgi:biopolymer transport protein TolR